MNDVQSYTGTGNNWSWDVVGEASIASAGEIGETSVPLNMVGNPQNLQFYFRADNAAFGGNTVDHFPDNAVDTSTPVAERVLEYRLTP